MPRRIRLVNPTADTLDVWLDRCFRHTRLGALPPGRTLQPRLPEQLISFPGGLRLHVQRVRGSIEYHGLFVVPVRPVPVLELVLSEDAMADPSELAPVEFGKGPSPTPVTVESEGQGGATSLFAVDGGAVLTWSCRDDGEGVVSLSLADPSVRPEIPVRVRIDGRGHGGAVAWRRSSGPGGDVVTAPAVTARELTRSSRTGRELTLVLPGPAPDVEHHFELPGLDAELDSLSCFAPDGAAD